MALDICPDNSFIALTFNKRVGNDSDEILQKAH